jgi:MFS family permease
MGLDTAPNANSLIGATNGVSIAGGLIGALLSSPAADRLGRKVSIFMSAALGVLGGALQAG